MVRFVTLIAACVTAYKGLASTSAASLTLETTACSKRTVAFWNASL